MPDIDDIRRELDGLHAKATPGEWRAGRMDMVSFDGSGQGTHKNIYTDDDQGGVHRATGEKLPYTVARGEGDECRENAQLITALVNHWPAISAALVEAETMRRKEKCLNAAMNYLRLIRIRCNIPAQPLQVCHTNPAAVAEAAIKEIESALKEAER